ncbi:unnamed protein product [Boreogadus saida]
MVRLDSSPRALQEGQIWAYRGRVQVYLHPVTDTGRGVADGVLGESEHCFAEQGKTLRSIPLYRGGLPLELLLTLAGGGPVWVLHDVSGYFTVFPIWLMRVRNVVLSASG